MPYPLGYMSIAFVYTLDLDVIANTIKIIGLAGGSRVHMTGILYTNSYSLEAES